MLVLAHIRSTSLEVASKPTRNGFVHPLRRTQKPTEGTGLIHPYFGESQWQKSLIVESNTTLKSTTRRYSLKQINVETMISCIVESKCNASSHLRVDHNLTWLKEECLTLLFFYAIIYLLG